MEKSNDIIILDKVSRYFKMGNISVKALDDFTYSFKKNRITAVVGKSGSGKSTLLNLIGCLEKPSSGKILVDGQDVSKFTETGSILFRREKIGFIFQSFNLIPNLTVIENVLLPLEFSRTKKTHRKKIELAAGLLEKLGISKERFKHTPLKLSGGEQQRVSIARALVSNPMIILADEPTGNIDEQTGKNIIGILKNLTCEGKTVIIVTHDITLKDMSDETVNLHDGKIVNKKY